MITDFAKKRVSEIENKKEYDEYIERVLRSDAPLEQREEVVEYAKKMHQRYDTADRTPTDEIIKDIEAGYADIDDIGGYN